MSRSSTRDRSSTSTTRPSRRRALLRAVSWHRRKLAAVAAALAVLTGVSAALPEGPATARVVVAARALAGGTVLGAEDVALRDLVTDALPDGALTDPAAVVGRTLAAPAADRQVLTGVALVDPSQTLAAGRVLAPVRLADAGLASLLRAGDRVDVLGTPQQGGKAAVVASDVRVVTVPALDRDADPGSSGALVLVEVPAATGTDLATAAGAGSLTVTWR